MKFPKYRDGTTETVQALRDHLANNGPIRLLVKFGVGRPRPYEVVDIRTIEWSNGTEVLGVFQQMSEVNNTDVEMHITLDQPMIDSMCRQCGIERVVYHG